MEEALDRMLSRVPSLGSERVTLLAAFGRVLAEPVISHRDIPPWANSSMDGFVV
ncbi:MAG: molybdopterin molybdenumtransferase MoeA, partial [Candidatus Methylomirabilia bacterium]